jgi:hypothetical protein
MTDRDASIERREALADQREIDAEARDSRVAQYTQMRNDSAAREEWLDRREYEADQRDVNIDQRERLLDQREQQLKERGRQAGERDREADERDRAADQREIDDAQRP